MLMADGGADRLPGMGRRGRGGFQSGMFGMTPELRALMIKAQQGQGQGGWPGGPVGMFMPGQGGGADWGGALAGALGAAPFAKKMGMTPPGSFPQGGAPDMGLIGKMYDGMDEDFPGAKSVKIMSGKPPAGGIPYGDEFGPDMVNKLVNAQLQEQNMSRKQKNKAKADLGIAREKKGKGGGSKPPASAPPPAQPAPPKKGKKAKVAPPVEY